MQENKLNECCGDCARCPHCEHKKTAQKIEDVKQDVNSFDLKKK